MGPGPLHLDYSRKTYLVLSSSSPAAPSLPTSSGTNGNDALAARLAYAGALGPGALATEHVYALQDVPSGAGEVASEGAQLVQRAKALLERTGEGRVDVMVPAMRAKRT